MSPRVSAIFQLLKVIMPEKCRALTILELNWNQRLGQDEIEHLSSYAHVVHTSANKFISRHRMNENVFKMSKDEKCTVLLSMSSLRGAKLGSLIKQTRRQQKPHRFAYLFFCKYGNHSSFRSCNSVRQLPFAVLSDVF